MYRTLEDLPEHVRETMPKEAQQTYLEAFQRSCRQYEAYRGGCSGQHAIAHHDAMLAVNCHFEKGMDGRYYPSGQVPEEHRIVENEEDQPGFLESLLAVTPQE